MKFLVYEGDPLTPYYPSNGYYFKYLYFSEPMQKISESVFSFSKNYKLFFFKDYVYRKNQKDLETLPKIQAQVIGYNVALELFKLIENNNNQVIDAWKGQMNVKYSYGGALSSGR